MKRILILLCLTATALSLSAQRTISYDMIQRNRNLNVKLTLKDSKTSDPISWASVYLVPDGDTTITHFALSDDKGDVLIEDVPTGKYELNAEMIGYLPYKKTYTFKGWEFDAGIIKLEENPEYLDAATVSAVGNAITVKKDTIEFNASSFKVGENAMLEDLLKKMPGMEVSEDGTVTLNGEKIDKITVGGKTFFFNDPNAALKNLPAKIVDKIKVVDKTKDDAEVKGIVTKDDKEKVMDVELKEEFTKGWYGNAKLGAGSTLTPETEDKLIDDRGLLYNGNAMVTGYTEKDQVVFIGNAYNAMEPGGGTITYYSGNDDADKDFNSLGGLDRNAKTGINYNTERIKGTESNLSVTYDNNGKVASQRSSRTSYQPDSPDLTTESAYNATGTQNRFGGTFNVQSKKNDKYHFHFRQSVFYGTESISSGNTSATGNGSDNLNTSTSASSSFARKFDADGMIYGGFKKLGKERRTLSASFYYSLGNTDKDIKEVSELSVKGDRTLKDLTYDADRLRYTLNGSISYSEPIGEKWTVQAAVGTGYNVSENAKDAFNPDGTKNDYYSSISDNYYIENAGMLIAQWKNDTTDIQFGIRADLKKNEVKAKSLGIETITGKDEWIFNWSPFGSIEYEKNTTSLYAAYYGYANQPSASMLNPVLDISNPIQITTGNIYLKPSYQHGLYSSFSTNNRETFSFINVYLNASLTTRNTVYASWIDEAGIRYAVPVNSMKPQSSASMHLSYNRPIGKERRFTFTASGNASISGNTSYQAKTRLSGLDTQNFDYYAFMNDFWGDSDGNLFYSGDSGFSESRTGSFNWGLSLNLKYSIEKLDVTAGARTNNSISKYSLDPSADMNTWNSTAFINALYQPGKDWEIGSNLAYRFYNGYSAGFGKPEWMWNMSVSKSIKGITLSLKAEDILNQTRSLRLITSAEYKEDVYNNVLGRFFLFSVSFNFGKMNSKKNSNVENAMWNMM